MVDGLQTPLEALAQGHGVVLPRGVAAPGLDPTATWSFTATARMGERVRGGGVLGTVPEGPVTHKIMVPFDLHETVELASIRDGAVTVDEPVARIRAGSAERTLTLARIWPVRRALPRAMPARGWSQRLFPPSR